MRLNARLLEDARGSRSTHASLYLHGPGALPEGPRVGWTAAPLERLVGAESESPRRAARTVADLDLIAPDDLDDAYVLDRLPLLRCALAESGDAWVEDGGVNARAVLTGDAPERDAVLGVLFEAAIVRLRRRRRWTPLRILRVELSDFRGIDHLVLALSTTEPTTALVGVNGTGKTTLLDAIVLLLSHVEAGIRGAPDTVREIADDDIANGRPAASVSITADVGGGAPITWELSRDREAGPAPASERAGLFALDEQIARIRAELAQGDVNLPIAVHYPVNRAVLDIPLRIRTAHPFEPLEAYDGALAGGSSNFRLFFEWFRQREDLENELRARDSDHRDHQLEAVRRAATSLLPGVTDLRVQRAPLRMLVTKGDWTLYVDQLSDGEKCLLAMAGDLARRLAMANPLADDPLQGGGVVIIDEIELHLHPGWQRRIVPALERTFPRCQFIVSTHSPAVLGHLPHESVFILKPAEGGIRVARPSVSEGMDVNRLLEDLLEVPSRPEAYAQKLSEMHQLLDAGDIVRARAIHVELAGTLGADDPALVKAEVLLRRREAAAR